MRKKFGIVAAVLLTLSCICCVQASPAKDEAGVPVDLVRVAGGTFEMGSPQSEAWRGEDELLHRVTLADFYIGKYEVTQKEYQAAMGQNSSTFKGEDLPVENISWLDAIAYCNVRSKAEGLAAAYTVDGQKVSWSRNADGYRLPTEAEWEYACRAGTSTPFNTETSIGPDEANYYGHYPYMIEENYFSQEKLTTKPGEYRQTTVPVGGFKPNKLGLYDMHGNVGEWVWDYYGVYEDKEQTDPVGPTSGTLHISRGGGWNDFAKNLRSAYRATLPLGAAAYNVGFRVARSSAGAAGKVEAAGKTDSRPVGKGKVLIAYFSWSGNTRGIAQQIQQQSGADLFEIQCKTPYSSDYNTVLQEAQRDQRSQARPALAAQVQDMGQYDTVIVGYPNWWASIPMPVASFLEAYDFTGKTIVPFCSHGGGRFGQSLTAIAKLVPSASLGKGLSVHYSGDSGLADEIARWLTENGITKQ